MAEKFIDSNILSIMFSKKWKPLFGIAPRSAGTGRAANAVRWPLQQSFETGSQPKGTIGSSLTRSRASAVRTLRTFGMAVSSPTKS